MPNDIRKTKEFKELCSCLTDINSLKKAKVYKNDVHNNAFRMAEAAFRAMIYKKLQAQYKDTSEKERAVEKDKEWMWLKDLYPSVLSRKKQILIMSMDKFLFPNQTFVEKPYYFYADTKNSMKDAVILIDEVDATKKTMLDRIIKESAGNVTDLIQVFRSIHSSFETTVFPAEMTILSEEQENGKYGKTSLSERVGALKKEAEEIYREYDIQYLPRVERAKKKENSRFLFCDSIGYTLVGGGSDRQYADIRADKEARADIIRFMKKMPSDGKSVQEMVGRIRGYIRYFQGAVSILAINYQQRQQEAGRRDYPRSSAIRSILHGFNLSEDVIDFLFPDILFRASRHKDTGKFIDHTLYEQGFSYYSFEDDPDDDLESHIRSLVFSKTPEKYLVRFAEVAKVIGMSATATIETALGNYDIRYLKNRLGDNFHEISPEERISLEEDFIARQKGYENVTIHTKLLGAGYDKASWKSLYPDEGLAMHSFEITQEAVDPKKKDFVQARYFRIVQAFNEFLSCSDIHSFLCFLTAKVNEKGSELNRDVLTELFSYLLVEKGLRGSSPSDMICYLYGENYEETKNSIVSRLSNGEKLFVITTYPTTGAGQDLKYPPAEGDEIVRVNDVWEDECRDFDAIYLDCPTNQLASLNEDPERTQAEVIAGYIFDAEYLRESGEISIAEAKRRIEAGFAYFSTKNCKRFKGLKSLSRTKSVKGMATRTIIQAIGRICRTNNKAKDIYIFADDAIIDRFDVSVERDRPYNREFLALLDEIKHQKAERLKTDEPDWILRAETASVSFNRFVGSFLSERYEKEWSADSIANWEKMRTETLIKPTCFKNTAMDGLFLEQAYCQLAHPGNVLYYQQEGDYREVHISFEKDADFPFEVSAKAARLDILMKNKTLYYYFKEHGFATEFAPGDYILNPSCFNNIYKGALGETCGECIFSLFELPLKKIREPEKYELFDFVSGDKKTYIDFKNWSESNRFDEEKMLEKVRKKALRCGCRRVIIANLLSSDMENVDEKTLGGIDVLYIPRLIREEDPEGFDVSMIDSIRRFMDGR